MKFRAPEQKINELKNVLQMAEENGYKCWQMEENCIGSTWGLMVTPLDNVLYIQFGDWGGFTFSLKYLPSAKNGSGCACLEDSVSTVDLETLKRAEMEGLRFARKLRATMYKDSASALKGYNLDEYVKI